MANIKKSIKEIVEDRQYTKECYVIYDDEGDFYIIYETMWRIVTGGWVYDVLMSFLKGKTEWPFTKKNIVRDKDRNLKEWQYLNKDVEDKIIDIDVLFIDGEKKN